MTKKSLPKKQAGGASPKKNLSKAIKPTAGELKQLNTLGLDANKDLRNMKNKRVVFAKTGSKGTTSNSDPRLHGKADNASKLKKAVASKRK